MKHSKLTGDVIGTAIKVHRVLGPGLLESVYKECLYYELNKLYSQVQKEVRLPIVYEDISFEYGYRLDILLDDELIIEVKAVDKLINVHKAQILTYMKLSKIKTGLLINFNEPLLKHGIKRFIF